MFWVVFRNRKRADYNAAAYHADFEAMLAIAESMPGFISFKSYTSADGEVVALSEWASDEAALAWRREVNHAEVQARGREHYYESYTLFAGAPTRLHRFNI